MSAGESRLNWQKRSTCSKTRNLLSFMQNHVLRLSMPFNCLIVNYFDLLSDQKLRACAKCEQTNWHGFSHVVCIMENLIKRRMFRISMSNYCIFYCFRVLVGAPEADTEQKRWGVEKPGAVFRCETNLPYR